MKGSLWDYMPSISGRNASSKILQMAWMYRRNTWRGHYEIKCLLFQAEMPVLRYYRWPGCTPGTHEGVTMRLNAFNFRQKCQFWDITGGLDVPQEHIKGSLRDYMPSISGRNASSKILQMAWMYPRNTWRGLYEIKCLLFQAEMPVLRYYRWPGCTPGTHEGVSMRLYAFYFRQKCQF